MSPRTAVAEKLRTPQRLRPRAAWLLNDDVPHWRRLYQLRLRDLSQGRWSHHGFEVVGFMDMAEATRAALTGLREQARRIEPDLDGNGLRFISRWGRLMGSASIDHSGILSVHRRGMKPFLGTLSARSGPGGQVFQASLRQWLPDGSSIDLYREERPESRRGEATLDCYRGEEPEPLWTERYDLASYVESSLPPAHPLPRPSEQIDLQATVAALPLRNKALQVVVTDDPFDSLVPQSAQVDGRVFAKHQALPVEGFRRILSNGGILVCHLGEVDGELTVVAESMSARRADPSSDSPVERSESLLRVADYGIGTAVDEAFRRMGIHQDDIAIRSGVGEALGAWGIIFSGRFSNLGTQVSMINGADAVVVASSLWYFSSNRRSYRPEDARVALIKDFSLGPIRLNRKLDRDIYPLELTEFGHWDWRDPRVAATYPYALVPMRDSDKPDRAIDAELPRILTSGYFGTRCIKRKGRWWMEFLHRDILDPDQAHRLTLWSRRLNEALERDAAKLPLRPGVLASTAA